MANHYIHPGMIPNLPTDIDLWLQVDAGWHFSVRPPAKIVALVETDPHVLKASYSMPKSYSDVTFCMQTPYMETVEVYLPYANVPTKFYPDARPFNYDAPLIGLHYPQRDKLVAALRSVGKTVYYDLGVVYDEYREMYNSSHVALSWSSMQDTPVRVFEAMGMFTPLVSNRTPDLVRIFKEGEHFLGFDTAKEAVEQVNRLQSDSILSVQLAKNAYKEVLANHTWDHRITQILNNTGLL